MSEGGARPRLSCLSLSPFPKVSAIALVAGSGERATQGRRRPVRVRLPTLRPRPSVRLSVRPSCRLSGLRTS